nr:thioesterase-like protein [Rhodospirillaceae bacterium]
MPDTAAIPAPLEIHTETVRPEWIDHNGHMNVAYYLLAFDEAAGAISQYIGYTNEYRKANNIGTF